jgi:hypothetical protein
MIVNTNMILAEIHGYKRYLDKDFYELMDLLKASADINHDGKFSTVVIPKTGDHVYKVWTNDDGYETYYNIAQRMQGNAFVPKLGRIRKLPIFFKRPDKVDGYLQIVKLEKLTKISKLSFARDLADLMKLLVQKVGLTGFKQEHAGSDIARFVKQHSDESFYKGFLEAKSKDLFELAVALRSALVNNEGDLELDIHTDNVMMRGSQPVVIDPLCISQDREDSQRSKNVLFMNHLSTNIDAINDGVQRGAFASDNTKSGSRPKMAT